MSSVVDEETHGVDEEIYGPKEVCRFKAIGLIRGNPIELRTAIEELERWGAFGNPLEFAHVLGGSDFQMFLTIREDSLCKGRIGSPSVETALDDWFYLLHKNG